MPWWGWILVGAILLGSELFVTTEFYLVVFGTAAMAVGLLAAALDVAVWEQWTAFAVLAVVFLVFFRQRIWSFLQRDGADRPTEGVLGEYATISQRIEPGGLAGRADGRPHAPRPRLVAGASKEGPWKR